MNCRFALIGLLLVSSVGAMAQEKQLNLYSARHYQTDERLYENFTKQTGIRINRIEGKEDELMERIRNEGANSPADAFITVEISDKLEIKVQKQAISAVLPKGTIKAA